MATPIDVFGVGKPRVYKYTKSVGGCVNPELIIGFELETEKCDRHTAKEYQKFGSACNIDVSTDGSLRGSAYEFISRPMPTAQALAAVGDFFELCKFTEENYTDRCSVHVHVNCTDMEMTQISSLALLYTVFEEILFSYVGGHRDSNIYCIPWNQCRQHLDLINRFLNDPGTSLKRWNKYTALNLIPLSSIGTVEFRQMHGTANKEKLEKWVNLIGSLFHWAKVYELKVLIAELKTLNSTSQYEAFFNKILHGLLPYEGIYRQRMEEGIILAKYSLVSMEKKRSKPSAKVVVPPAPAGIMALDVEENRAAFQWDRMQVAAGVVGPRPEVRIVRNRIVPAPDVVRDGLGIAQVQQEAQDRVARMQAQLQAAARRAEQHNAARILWDEVRDEAEGN